MAVKDWSSTASANTSVGGLTTDGNIQTVNNIDGMFRGMMADIRTGINVGQFLNQTYVAKSGNYTAVEADRGSLMHFTASATLSLTAAATLTAGWWLMVRARGGSITVDPNGTELINGTTTLSISDGHSALIVCTGTAFMTFADSGGGHLVNIRVLTTSQTYTPNSTIKSLVVELVGGGGSGGAASTSATTQASAGSGGGAGGYVFKRIAAPAAATVVIGAGGAAVTSSGSPANGNSGGVSTYTDGVVSLTASFGGSGFAIQTTGCGVIQGGQGGSAAGGDINVRGEAAGYAVANGATGTGSSTTSAASSNGGTSNYGYGGRGGAANNNVSDLVQGTDGEGYGAGGSGSVRINNAAGNSTSGAGMPGVCIIWEYA